MNRQLSLWILISCLFIFGNISITFSQEIEHNYKVGPQYTSCDSLNIVNSGADQAIEKIRSAKFRFQQTFKLTRKAGFKGAEFYSCDGENGYLIVNYTQNTFLYSDVKIEIWEKLKTSRDPEGFYMDIKEGLMKKE